MAKEIFKIPGFHGGLNEGMDPRDIKDEEASVLSGYDISVPGILKPMGLDELVIEFSAAEGGLVVGGYTTNPALSTRGSGFGAYEFQHEKMNMCEHMGLYFRHTTTDDSYRVAIPGDLADADYSVNPWKIPPDCLIGMRIRNYSQNTSGIPAWGTVTDNEDFDASTEGNITVTHAAMADGDAVSGTSDDHWQTDSNGDIGLIDKPRGGGEQYVLFGWSTDLGDAGVGDARILTYNRNRAAEVPSIPWSIGLSPMHTGNAYVTNLFWEAEGRLFVQNIESYGNPAHNIDTTLNPADQAELGSVEWNSYNSHYEVQYVRQRSLLQDTAEGTAIQYSQRYKYPGRLGSDYDGWVSSHWPIHKTRAKAFSHNDNGLSSTHRISWGEDTAAASKGGCMKLELAPAGSGDAGTWVAAGSNATPPSYYELYVTQYNQYGEESMMRVCGADNDSGNPDDGLRFSLPNTDPANVRMVGRVTFNFSEGWIDPNSYDQPFHEAKSTIASAVGTRFWISKYPDYPNERYLLLDANIEHGVRVSGSDDSWTRWSVTESSGGGSTTFGTYDGLVAVNYAEVDLDIADPPTIITFEDLNGYRHDAEMVGQYKCAAVLGKHSYVGNLTNYHTGQINNDAICKSPTGKFGIHPWANREEVVPMDGDEVIQLSTFAERLLVFKQRKLFILNCSQEAIFLEDTMDFGGVTHPGAVTSTEQGIMWCNRWGVYLYNGERVIDLLKREGRSLISREVWEDFYEDSGETVTGSRTGGSIIGYIPKKKWLLIVRNCAAGSQHGQGYILDLALQSWMKQKSVFDSGESKNCTNMFNSGVGGLGAGDLHYYSEATGSVQLMLRKIVLNAIPGSTYANTEYATKDFDFGSPGVRKKVYKVYISYKGYAPLLEVQYVVNGESDLDNDCHTFNNDITPLEDKTNTEDLEIWHVAELKPTTSATANNIYSFRIYIAGTVKANFEINDISIVYRNKRVK